MAQIRDIAVIAEKYATVTPQRQGEYQNGVTNPLRDWKASTLAANQNYKDGTTLAIQQDRFGKGVNKSSTQKWQRGAVEKGVSRWGQGVQLGAADYAQKFAPFAAAIKALVLPARFPRRDPRNLARVNAVVQTMISTAQQQSS